MYLVMFFVSIFCICFSRCRSVFFFFSSRRRHTRCGRDWSSDVCSSDLLAGADIDQAGRSGVTNGAAMRIAPVGIATPSADLGGLVDRVVEASRATHNTGVALAGAAAVAAAVSAGLDGAEVPDAIGLAVTAARRAARRGHWVAAADVAARITWATGLTAELAGRPGGPDAGAVIDVVYTLVGTSLAVQESVPAAFAVLAASPDDPWLACRIAARSEEHTS